MNRILSCREWNSNSLGTNERNESAIETGFAILSGGGVSLIRIGTKEMSGRVLLRLVKNFRESLRPKCFFFFLRLSGRQPVVAKRDRAEKRDRALEPRK